MHDQPTGYPRGMSHPAGILIGVVVGAASFALLHFAILHRQHYDLASLVGVVTGVVAALLLVRRRLAR